MCGACTVSGAFWELFCSACSLRRLWIRWPTAGGNGLLPASRVSFFSNSRRERYPRFFRWFMRRVFIFSLGLCLAEVAVAGEERGMPPAAAEQVPATPTPAPLMYLLDQAGLAKPLKDLGINLYGYVEAGYFYDFSAPHHEDGPTFM